MIPPLFTPENIRGLPLVHSLENDSLHLQYPLRLSDIKSVIYKESKKGRFRYLFIHDSGLGFLEIRTSKSNADRIVAQIMKANPDAKVEHAHYL